MGEASTINKVHATRNSSFNAPFSRRRSSIRALSIHLDEATRLFPFSRVPRTCFAVDQTTSDLPSARHARRSDQKEVRTHCRKRAPTATIDHPSSTGQTTRLRKDGSVSLGAAGQGSSELETSALPCSAGNA